MSTYRIFAIIGICWAFASPCFAQDNTMPFIPSVFWSEQAGKGVILNSPSEMVPVDAQGTKYSRIVSSEPVANASISPDGKKIVYATATGLWIVSVDSPVSSKVYSGTCDVPRWNKDGTGFVFAVYERKNGMSGVFSVKLFWADFEGKNLRQIYP